VRLRSVLMIGLPSSDLRNFRAAPACGWNRRARADHPPLVARAGNQFKGAAVQS
jgi:hypothetical protein